jgi:hypothetical protein
MDLKGAPLGSKRIKTFKKIFKRSCKAFKMGNSTKTSTKKYSN